jgi:hypothetical protein
MTGRRVALATVVALTVLFAACSSGNPSGATGGPGTTQVANDERIDLQVVPTPAGIHDVRFPWFTADGTRVVYTGRPDGDDRDELLSIAVDGSAPACLTCGVSPATTDPINKPIVFKDGRRVVVAVGEQNPLKSAHHAVVECTPSVDDCRSAQLVPIVVSPSSGAPVTQDQREMRISPDGTKVAFTQIRTTPTGEPAFVATVADLRQVGDHYETSDPRVVSTLGELKNFTPDGQHVLIAAFTTLPDEAANPDDVEIDLATGAQTRVTFDNDYDEDIELSPDQQWYVVASGRTAGLFQTVSQVKRPNFIGPGLEPLAAYPFTQRRKELLEPWLVRVGAEADGDQGQRLNPSSPAAGYDGRTLQNWSPDGTRVLFWEGRGEPSKAPGDDSRLVIAHLADRAARAAPAAAPTPDPTWASPLDGFTPTHPPPMPSRAGRKSGSVDVSSRADDTDPTRTVLTVTYHQFSDDGAWVLDGTEQTDGKGGILGTTRYTAHLTLTGQHRGGLDADATLSPGGIQGTITSTVDDHALHLP